jgi:hypothetical protein
VTESEEGLQPLSYDLRRALGYCTCAQRVDASPPPDVCLVHGDDDEMPESEREARGLMFFDDRRNRFVTWPDAVEGMRQRRYAGAVNDDLMVFTWAMLIRLLEALHDPLGDPAEVITNGHADALVAWSDSALPEDHRRWLLTFARGGGSMALSDMFRNVARSVVGEPRQVTT